MNAKNRIKRLESEVCPVDSKYGVLIYGHRQDPRSGKVYIKDKKIVGEITSVLEWANGKIVGTISPSSDKGKKMLIDFGYKIMDKKDNG